MAQARRRINFSCMNMKFSYVIVLNEKRVCAKNHAVKFLERMFGLIGCSFPDQGYM